MRKVGRQMWDEKSGGEKIGDEKSGGEESEARKVG